MKICYANAGVNIYDHLFINFLVNKGHEVHLITFYPLQRTYEKQEGLPTMRGIHIHHFDTERILRIRSGTSSQGFFKIVSIHVYAVSMLSILVRKIRPDVLNGHFVTNYGLWSALSGYHPFLLTVWGSDILVLPNRLFLPSFLPSFIISS